MAITETLIASGVPISDSPITTGAFNVSAGRLVTVALNICTTSTPGTPTVVDSNSVSWAQVGTGLTDYVVTAATVRHHSLYVFQHYYSGAQTGITLTYTFTGTGHVESYAVIQWNPAASETLEIKTASLNKGTGTGASISIGEGAAFADATNDVTYVVMATAGSTNSAITPEHTEIFAGNNGSISVHERQNMSNQWVVGEDATVTGTGNGDAWGAIFIEIGAQATADATVSAAVMKATGSKVYAASLSADASVTAAKMSASGAMLDAVAGVSISVSAAKMAASAKLYAAGATATATLTAAKMAASALVYAAAVAGNYNAAAAVMLASAVMDAATAAATSSVTAAVMKADAALKPATVAAGQFVDAGVMTASAKALDASVSAGSSVAAAKMSASAKAYAGTFSADNGVAAAVMTASAKLLAAGVTVWNLGFGNLGNALSRVPGLRRGGAPFSRQAPLRTSNTQYHREPPLRG